MSNFQNHTIMKTNTTNTTATSVMNANNEEKISWSKLNTAWFAVENNQLHLRMVSSEIRHDKELWELQNDPKNNLFGVVYLLDRMHKDLDVYTCRDAVYMEYCFAPFTMENNTDKTLVVKGHFMSQQDHEMDKFRVMERAYHIDFESLIRDYPIHTHDTQKYYDYFYRKGEKTPAVIVDYVYSCAVGKYTDNEGNLHIFAYFKPDYMQRFVKLLAYINSLA